jgi:hypothetical protein
MGHRSLLIATAACSRHCYDCNTALMKCFVLMQVIQNDQHHVYKNPRGVSDHNTLILITAVGSCKKTRDFRFETDEGSAQHWEVTSMGAGQRQSSEGCDQDSEDRGGARQRQACQRGRRP